jgi:hypothetical protein
MHSLDGQDVRGLVGGLGLQELSRKPGGGLGRMRGRKPGEQKRCFKQEIMLKLQ